jgi:hypothetical protein
MRCVHLATEHEYCPVANILASEPGLPTWVQRQFETDCLWYTLVGPVKLHVKTLRGWLCAPDDGYLILGNGEVWPIEKWVFAERYRIIEEKDNG